MVEKISSFSNEDRDEIQQVIGLNKMNAAQAKIKEISQQCSDISKKLAEENLSETEREELGTKLRELVEEGNSLGEEKTDAIKEMLPS